MCSFQSHLFLEVINFIFPLSFQGQIFAQQMEISEPIYQNIPLHEKLLEMAADDDLDDDDIQIDETVEGVPFGRISGSRISPDVAGSRISPDKSRISPEKSADATTDARPVSRLGLTDKSAAGSRLSSPPPDVSPDVGPRLANGVSGDDSEEKKSGRSSATAKKYSEPRKKMELRQYLEPAVSKTSSTSVEVL